MMALKIARYFTTPSEFSIADYEDVALSDSQLLRLIDRQASLVLYPELGKYDTLDDMLGPHRACILLFEAKPNYGHWCCLFRRGNLIEFFNPYGGYPDDSLEYIPMHFRKISGQYYPLLTILMMNSPYKLSFNEHAFQQFGPDIKTCGRHCAVRLAYRDLPLDQYTHLLKQLGKKLNMDADGVVTAITAEPDQL